MKKKQTTLKEILFFMTVYYIVFPLFSFVSTMDRKCWDNADVYNGIFFWGGGICSNQDTFPWNSWTSNQYWFRLCTKYKCYYKSGLSEHICVDLCVYKSRAFPCICLLVCLCSTLYNVMTVNVWKPTLDFWRRSSLVTSPIESRWGQRSWSAIAIVCLHRDGWCFDRAVTTL